MIFFLLLSFSSNAQEKDLRQLFEKYNIGVYDQGKRGTCSVFAITGLLEFEYAHTTGIFLPFSVEFLNWASNQVTGEPEDGSYFSDALTALNKYGICVNDLFPYYIQNYTKSVAPSAVAIRDAKKRRIFSALWIKEWDPNMGMTDTQISEVKNQILNEHPVAIGFLWPKKEEQYSKIVNEMMYVPPREGVFDGHSVIIVGFKDDPGVQGGGYFVYKNSHGPDENGYGKMPYEYARQYANDGVVIYLKR